MQNHPITNVSSYNSTNVNIHARKEKSQVPRLILNASGLPSIEI